MNDPVDAQDWRDMAQHLIEAHGASAPRCAGGQATMPGPAARPHQAGPAREPGS